MKQKKRHLSEKSVSNGVYETEKTPSFRKKCVKLSVWNRKNISSQKKVRQNECMEQKNGLKPEKSASKRVYETEKSTPPRKKCLNILTVQGHNQTAFKKTLRPEPECFCILI
jgi:hypothetical protein